jgi:phage recombination protein Bet
MGELVKSEKKNLVTKLGGKYGVDGNKLYDCLKNTIFRQSKDKKPATDEEMMALMIVADQYNLNPFIKEIYAFPDTKSGGIIPILGVDGWSRIINEHPQFDGVQFSDDGESCTCTIHRKDRNHPTVITEYLTECRRDTNTWRSHPRRMLRHKALIQCSRVAFGFTGIYDHDEGLAIIEAQSGRQAVAMPTPKLELPAPVVEPEIVAETVEDDEYIAGLDGDK